MPEFHSYEGDNIDGDERVESGYPYLTLKLHPHIFEEEHFEDGNNYDLLKRIAVVICMGIHKM